MSAELLREAARLMRERAEAATPGPWVRIATSSCGPGTIGGNMGADYDSHVYMGSDFHPDDAAHIASWHPAVVLAVADWLEAVEAESMTSAGSSREVYEAALSVARAYLGAES